MSCFFDWAPRVNGHRFSASLKMKHSISLSLFWFETLQVTIFWVQGCFGTHWKGRWASQIAPAYARARYDFVFEQFEGGRGGRERLSAAMFIIAGKWRYTVQTLAWLKQMEEVCNDVGKGDFQTSIFAEALFWHENPPFPTFIMVGALSVWRSIVRDLNLTTDSTAH